MKKSLSLLSASAFSLALCACSEIPREAYYNRGAPESLLNASSEVVNVNLGSPGGMDELIGWINRDMPTRAELTCISGDYTCNHAKDVLRQFNVSYTQNPEARNTVALHYERVAARDCESRYIDNSINPYNLNHPTFGCSNAANIVQMVSDKRQFVSPALLDAADAEKSAKVYGDYINPPAAPNNNQSSLLSLVSGATNASAGGSQ